MRSLVKDAHGVLQKNMFKKIYIFIHVNSPGARADNHTERILSIVNKSSNNLIIHCKF